MITESTIHWITKPIRHTTTALPVLLPWAIGFSVGALVYLVLVELLPESYRQAGPTSIALVTLVAMGIVVALTGGGL